MREKSMGRRSRKWVGFEAVIVARSHAPFATAGPPSSSQTNSPPPSSDQGERFC